MDDFGKTVNKLMKNPEFRREWEALEPEYQLKREIIGARIRKKMTQEELAKKAGTAQAVISRLENMTVKPSLALLERVAKALDSRLVIKLKPLS